MQLKRRVTSFRALLGCEQEIKNDKLNLCILDQLANIEGSTPSLTNKCRGVPLGQYSQLTCLLD